MEETPTNARAVWPLPFGWKLVWRDMAWPLERDDVAVLAVVSGLIGGCVLLGLLVGWFAGVGLFFALLVLWGVFTLRALPVSPLADLAAERHDRET